VYPHKERKTPRCNGLLDQVDESAPEDARRLVQTAALYFVLDDDAESDIGSAAGFLDDEAVVDAVETVLSATAGR
jgi:uncharacterized membrane protein YkvA (DUF1232 family)